MRQNSYSQIVYFTSYTQSIMLSPNSRRLVAICFLLIPTMLIGQITISQPAERKIFQRDNQNYALVPVQGVSASSVDSVLAFFKPVQSGQGERQLFKLELQIDAQNFRGRCKLKGGWYQLEINSFKNGVIVAASIISKVGVGEVFLIWGHSVASGGMTTPEHGATDDRVNSIDYYNDNVIYENLPHTVSHLNSDHKISPFGKYAHCWSWFGDSVVKKYNVPVMLYSSAFGGSNVQQNAHVLKHIPFTHGFINYSLGYPYKTVDGAMKVYTPLFGVRAVFVHHGSNDRDFSGQEFKDNLRTVIDTTRARNNMPNLAFMMVQDARWFVGNSMTHICDAQQQIVSESNQSGGIANVFAGADLKNTPNDPNYTPDQLHFDRAGIEYLGNKWATAITPEFLNQSQPYLATTPPDWPIINGRIVPTPPLITISAQPDNMGTIASNSSIASFPILYNDNFNGTSVSLSSVNISIVSPPKKGIAGINSDGSLKYIPIAGKLGRDTLTYKMCDSQTNTVCRTAEVAVSIIIGISAQSDDMGNIYSNANISNYAILNNDYLNGVVVSANQVNISIIDQPKKGTVSINTDGSLKYIPTAGKSGKDTLSYKICDKSNASICETAKVFVNINAIISAQSDDMGNVYSNANISNYAILNNDYLNGVIVNSNQVNISIIDQPKKGTVSINSDGSLKYIPTAGKSGKDTLSYKICDKSNTSICDIAYVFVNISIASLSLNVKVFLEGAMRGNVMGTELNQQGLLPGQIPVSSFAQPTPSGQPYTTTPWNFSPINLFNTYDADVVDWVLVSLRTSPENVNSTVYKTTALLRSDGHIVFFENITLLTTATSFYVGIEHRNHIGVVSDQAVQVINGKIEYDFTTKQAYVPTNTISSAQKRINSIYVLYGADAKKTALFEINAEDGLEWRKKNGTFGRYLVEDFNLDGAVDALDQLIFRKNNGVFAAIPFW